MGVNEGDELGDGIFATLLREADVIATRIRSYNERRLLSAIALEKRTIDIRVEEISEAKAVELLAQKLKASKDWVKQTDQAMLTLLRLGRWFGSGFSGLIFYFLSVIAFGVWFYAAGINNPPVIGCQNQKTLCYQLRWDKSKILILEKTQQVPQKFHRKKY